VLLTIDDRTCSSVCTTNPTPGEPGAPSPPEDALLGQPDYGPGSNVDEDYDGVDVPETEIDDSPPSEATKVECDEKGTDSAFDGPTGK